MAEGGYWGRLAHEADETRRQPVNTRRGAEWSRRGGTGANRGDWGRRGLLCPTVDKRIN